MKKRSIIELTSLLDIILILLFAFMLNMNTAGESLHEENLQLKEQTTFLTGERQGLQTELDQLQTQMEAMQFTHEKEKKTLGELAKGIARFLEVEEEELLSALELVESNDYERMERMLNQVTERGQIVKELWKHEMLVKRFYFIEVGLKHSTNQLYINDSQTTVTIHHDELKNSPDRINKKEKIKDTIERFINEREGGIGMMVISLTLLDQEVYQYAYEITWEAIKELQEKYGTDKVFITEYTLLM